MEISFSLFTVKKPFALERVKGSKKKMLYLPMYFKTHFFCKSCSCVCTSFDFNNPFIGKRSSGSEILVVVADVSVIAQETLIIGKLVPYTTVVTVNLVNQ